MRVHFGYILCPWSFKKDSRGRSRCKEHDVRFILERSRHGGCCFDIRDTFVCARCDCHVSMEMEFTADDEIIHKLSVYWHPDQEGP